MMKVPNKSGVRLLKLSAAVAAALALQVGVAQAQTVSDTGSGSAVFVPYYTINDGWRTLVNITNTSENSLAIKFRLHEARNSRDVLDFVVLLSPFDVWTAWVEMGGDGRPFLQTTDRSCTVPISVRDSGTNASELAYSGRFSDHQATDGNLARMSEGYIEVLVMGETEGSGFPPAPPPGNGTNVEDPDDANFRGSTAWFATHVDGEPRNCQLIQNDFVRRTVSWGGGPTDPIPSQADLGHEGSASPLARNGSTSEIAFQNQPAPVTSAVGYDVIGGPNGLNTAPLKVNVSLVNRSEGTAGGIESLHIDGWGVGQNLVTAQQFPWFLEPSLASAAGLWSTAALPAINAGIQAFSVANEWTNNPNTGALSDWVVNFPSKRFQADEDAASIQAACSIWRNDGSAGGATNGTVGPVWAGWPVTATRPNELGAPGVCPDLGFPTVFQDGNDGRADLVVQYNIFDREEGQITVVVDGPVVSPAPPPDVTIDNLPWEVNVLTIGRNAAELPSALDSLIALSIDTSELPSGANQGWLRMSFLDDAGQIAYPVTGFIFKARDFGNPMLNFGQATEHAYERSEPPVLP